MHYSALALAAGIGIPIMATISGALSIRLGSTTAATAVLFFGAFVIALVALAINGLPTTLSFNSAPPYLYIGGIFVAFYVLSITWLVPRFGVGNAIFVVLLGQIISASIIDHFGLFNAQIIPMSTTRLFGIILMVIGIFLSRKIS